MILYTTKYQGNKTSKPRCHFLKLLFHGELASGAPPTGGNPMHGEPWNDHILTKLLSKLFRNMKFSCQATKDTLSETYQPHNPELPTESVACLLNHGDPPCFVWERCTICLCSYEVLECRILLPKKPDANRTQSTKT